MNSSCKKSSIFVAKESDLKSLKLGLGASGFFSLGGWAASETIFGAFDVFIAKKKRGC